MMKRILAGFIVALTLTGAAVAGPFEDGLAAYDGNRMPQDYVEAVKLFRLAAEQGNADAQYMLGVMCRGGKGVAQSDEEAVKWYRLAAEQGLSVAQNMLGLHYENGRGVPKDYLLAHMWFNLSAAQGAFYYEQRRRIRFAVDEQGRTVSFIYLDAEYNRDRLALLMTPDQVVDAQRMAREWLATH